MYWLLLAIVFTVSLSFVCSLTEAVILSTTVAEIEALKKIRPKRGKALELLKSQLGETISAILSLNTLANSLGSVAVGYLGERFLSGLQLIGLTVGFGIVLLIGSEVLPKNLGVAHRRRLQPFIVYPLRWLVSALVPVISVCNLVLRLFVRGGQHSQASDEEIILLAEKGAQEGTLTMSESNIIANALSLDNVRVSAVMTPRTVVSALPRSATVGAIFRDTPSLPFGRIPVFGKNLDDIVGIVRRRDLLKAKAHDQDAVLVEQLMSEVHFVPETVTVANALQVILKVHQKMLVAVDEFGATAGVITMEDIIEHLLGREIFEKDDVAVDMRELARSRLKKPPKGRP